MKNTISDNFREMQVFKLSYCLTLDIHKISNTFPDDEKYLLVNQIRRSSRAICANIAEAYGKRKYPKHFTAKLSDADSENNETLLWLKFAKDFNYINSVQYQNLSELCRTIGKMIGGMMKCPEKFMPRK